MNSQLLQHCSHQAHHSNNLKNPLFPTSPSHPHPFICSRRLFHPILRNPRQSPKNESTTGHYCKSQRRECHQRLQSVWHSISQFYRSVPLFLIPWKENGRRSGRKPRRLTNHPTWTIYNSFNHNTIELTVGRTENFWGNLESNGTAAMGNWRGNDGENRKSSMDGFNFLAKVIVVWIILGEVKVVGKFRFKAVSFVFSLWVGATV
jgi:hypothetical protein